MADRGPARMRMDQLNLRQAFISFMARHDDHFHMGTTPSQVMSTFPRIYQATAEHRMGSVTSDQALGSLQGTGLWVFWDFLVSPSLRSMAFPPRGDPCQGRDLPGISRCTPSPCTTPGSIHMASRRCTGGYRHRRSFTTCAIGWFPEPGRLDRDQGGTPWALLSIVHLIPELQLCLNDGCVNLLPGPPGPIECLIDPCDGRLERRAGRMSAKRRGPGEGWPCFPSDGVLRRLSGKGGCSLCPAVDAMMDSTG